MKGLLSAYALVAGIAGGSGWAHQQGEEVTAERFGTVAFMTSCAADQRENFNRAVATLHSFWYVAAEKTFRAVAAADPDCAMAHWGVAMTYYHQIWAPPSRADLENGARAVALARKVGARTSREKDYIEAIGAFYDKPEGTPHAERTLAYAAAMDRLQRAYPDDKEAAIFNALALEASAPVTDKNYADQRKAAAILEALDPALPDHPGIAHYLIHAYDYPPLARQGLPAARRYAAIAPSSAHALHMPSHIFIRLGLWDEAIEADLAAAAVAQRYGDALHPGATAIEQLHSMDYLMYAYLQGTQDAKAKALLERHKAVGKVNQQTITAAYALAAIPARYALERGQWEEAATLSVRPADFPWDRFPHAEAITHFARAMGAAHVGRFAAAQDEILRLAALRDALATRDEYWASQVEIQRKTAAAWVALAQGKNDEALDLMRAAADQEDSGEKNSVTPGPVVPAREWLGDMLVQSGRPADALKEYEIALTNAPNRHGSLVGAARSAELSGDPVRARYFSDLVATLTAKAEGDRAFALRMGTFSSKPR